MEIKDNEFSRQFEATVDNKTYAIEYSIQDRKMFLTKVNIPEGETGDDVITEMLKEILATAEDKRMRVMPIHPKVVTFFKKNPGYKDMLPPGIRL